MKASPSSDADGRQRENTCEQASCRTGRRAPRTPRVTVDDPKIAVVGSVESADPAALDAAITLFVKWAIRAHESANPESPEAPTDHLSAD